MFYFAWVDPTDTTFDPAFARNDEEILSFLVGHDEADFPYLNIEIRNPRVGLLSAARKRWAWLSWDGATGPEPLIFGRLVGVPDNTQDETLRLTLTSRPADFAAQKEAVAASLRVLPWFDPVWISADRRADADLVLEARSALWHIDRISHVVSVSDIIAGEDGVIDLAGDFFRDSLNLRYTQIPARQAYVSAEVSWSQVASGDVDISEALCAAFAEAGTTRANTISTYTGEGLLRDWPPAGNRIGGGWSVGEVRLPRIDGVSVKSRGTIANTRSTSKVYFPLWIIRPGMSLRYDVSRARVEGVTFTLAGDTQAVISEPDGEDAIEIRLQSSAVAEAIDGELPIGEPHRRSYFQTERGLQSLQNLVLRARAQLVARARAVEIIADIPFADAVALSCRHSATIADDRLPGGTATGKVVSYSFAMDGDSGRMSGSVTIACAVGQGGTITPEAGVPAYSDAGYADAWQASSGGEVLLASGDVAIGNFGSIEIADDGMIFPLTEADQVVQSLTVTGGQTEQEAKLAIRTESATEAAAALNTVFTEISLGLVQLDGLSFRTDYELSVSDLAIPKTIDLEAGA